MIKNIMERDYNKASSNLSNMLLIRKWNKIL